MTSVFEILRGKQAGLLACVLALSAGSAVVAQDATDSYLRDPASVAALASIDLAMLNDPGVIDRS